MLSVFTSAVGRTFIDDQHSVVGELDALDAPDFHAGHLDAVADFEVLHVG